MAELEQTTTDDCCSTEMQATCCEPTEKSACCEAATGGACGCSAGSAIVHARKPA